MTSDTLSRFSLAPLSVALASALLVTTACSSDNAPSTDAGSDTTTASSDSGADVSKPPDAGGGQDAMITVETGSGTEAGSDAAVGVAADAGGDGGAGDGGASAADAGPVTFAANVWNPIFSVHCVGCHGLLADGGPGGGIRLGHLDMGDAAVA